jgi:hypothetical protein
MHAGLELAVGRQVGVVARGAETADDDVQPVVEELLLVGEQAQVEPVEFVLVDVLLLGERAADIVVEAVSVVPVDGDVERAAGDVHGPGEVDVGAEVELADVGMSLCDAARGVAGVLVDQVGPKVHTVLCQSPGQWCKRRRRWLPLRYAGVLRAGRDRRGHVAHVGVGGLASGLRSGGFGGCRQRENKGDGDGGTIHVHSPPGAGPGGLASHESCVGRDGQTVW